MNIVAGRQPPQQQQRMCTTHGNMFKTSEIYWQIDYESGVLCIDTKLDVVGVLLEPVAIQ